MILVLSMLLITIIVFACVFLHLFIRLVDAEGRITLLEVKADYSEKSEKTLRESVNIHTKCIRDLNDIVKKSVENKEPTEPDTKALEDRLEGMSALLATLEEKLNDSGGEE